MHSQVYAVGQGECFGQPLLLRHPAGPVDPRSQKFMLKPR
jgi:hypothetical protein